MSVLRSRTNFNLILPPDVNQNVLGFGEKCMVLVDCADKMLIVKFFIVVLKVLIGKVVSSFVLVIDEQGWYLLDLVSWDEFSLSRSVIFHIMETLVAVASQHKHQYCTTKSRSQCLARFNSPPSTKFKGINCRTSYAADGILPTPLRALSTSPKNNAPPSLKASASPPPLTEASPLKPAQIRSNPIPIRPKASCHENFPDEGLFDVCLSFSERWAGPTYSNSPPPSSVPIPKFLHLSERSRSLDFPNVASNDHVLLHPISKSAPASPVREFSPPISKDFSSSIDSATKTLCRILNLRLSDE